jgi:hypothetical protein
MRTGIIKCDDAPAGLKDEEQEMELTYLIAAPRARRLGLFVLLFLVLAFFVWRVAFYVPSPGMSPLGIH